MIQNVKVLNHQIVFREFPDEVTLAFNFSSCPNMCKGCHTPELREYVGYDFHEDILEELIESNPSITCIGLMGGDAYPQHIQRIALYIKTFHPRLKVGWYSGRYWDGNIPLDINNFDYIKLGPYIPECGSLDNISTNQRMFQKTPGAQSIREWKDITYKFWKK